MSKSLSKLFPLFLLIVLLIPLTTQAALVEIKNPVRANTFQELVDVLVNIIFTLALVIAPIMFIIAGFYYLTAAGDPKKVETAKKIILYTLVGLIIVISARGIMELFRSIFLRRSP